MFEPTITVRLNGVVELSPFTVSGIPDGIASKPSTSVCGSSLTLFVSVRPVASFATSCSSIHDGYEWSGAVNEPLATPLKCWIACVWQLFGSVGQWWMIRCQVRSDAGSVPSSGSDACPEKLIVSPTFQVRVAAGVSIAAVGGCCDTVIFTVVVSVWPSGSLTRSAAV